MRIAVILLLSACAVWPQSSLPPDLEILTQVRARMVWNLQHQPNYTCTETVERMARTKGAHKAQLIDTLRLEVALVDGKEMFAWPGSKNFNDFDLRKMVTQGAIGNGNFASHARSVFIGRSATFQFRGDEDLDGRKSVRFDFKVPKMLSGYTIRVGEQEAIVAYHGSFWANPATFNLRRLEVVADDIPLELSLSAASDRIDYEIARIGDGDFLLPLESELTMVDLSGRENRNHVRFASCRQFTGESILKFDEAPTSSAAELVAVREITLPKDLELRLKLLDEINLRTAAIGDPWRAQLENDVKHKGELLIAKGAIASGRILRLERHDTDTLLGIELNELEAPGLHVRFTGTLDQFLGVEMIRQTRQPLLMKAAPQPGEAIIPLRSDRVIVPRGCIMFWRTKET